MTPQNGYVWRLIVTYPEGIDWQNPPDTWQERWIAVDETDTFHWPRDRRYLSAHSANRRAELLRHYGCTVVVERSASIVWPSAPANTDGQR